MTNPAQDFLDFIDSSPSPFHTVQSATERLVKAGFKGLRERDSWSSLQPGGKYYVTRNGSSIVAFAIGQKWTPGKPIAMIGAHTDSPCLRIKPVSKKQSDGYVQVGVETYGGGLWHTWFDRDLSLAGRLMVRGKNGSFESKLVHVKRPILRIPTLAIHLDRQETFSFNKETQLLPIGGLVAAELNRSRGKETKRESDESPPAKTATQPLKAMTERHHPYVLEILAQEAGVKPADIVDFEIVLYDTQPATIGGLNSELVFAARLDNLGMSYCATMGLIRSVSLASPLASESAIRLISLFDHEEIGSTTAQGADSNLLPAVLTRLSALNLSDTSPEDSYDSLEILSQTAQERSLATSFLISADMAHAVHPNYPQKYEADHRPEMNAGTVIKINANARYATNAPGIVLLEEVARRAKPEKPDGVAGVPLQLFVVRNDSSCGSTIGPMLSAKLGVRTLDLGNPQLSMHSIRETGGVHDVSHAIRLFDSFFEHYSEIEAGIFVD
ncbi:MAG: hypothetical protein M1814_002767 [Vezdaea aestivalis]|nr:MAG: hypothetical protein M1814_002767 [Vezdaea aestivalis]